MFSWWPALAFEMIPAGTPSRLNEVVTADSQDHATVAMGRKLRSLVVWHSEEEPGTAGGLFHNIRGRIFDRRGVAQGLEFLVNAALPGDQLLPDVSSDGVSRFVVVWSNSVDGLRHDVRAKVLSLNGTVVKEDFTVSESSSETEIYSAVAMNGTGEFVVLWSEINGNVQAFFARAYTAAGSPLSAPLRVDSLPVSADTEGLPDIVLNDQGQALAAWVAGTSPESCAVVCSVFDIHDSSVLPPEEPISPPSAAVRQKRPMVDMNERGDRVVVWTEEEGLHAAAMSRTVFFRKFFGSSGKWSDKVRVPDNTDLDNRRGTVALFPNGEFVVAWASEFSQGDNTGDIFLRGYGLGAQCDPLFGEMLVNEGFLSGQQTRPSLSYSTTESGGFLTVTWESEVGPGDKDEYRSVFRLRRWAVPDVGSGVTRGPL